MLEKMNKPWIRVVALIALMALALPVASFAANNNDSNIKGSVMKTLNPYGNVSISVDKGRVTLSGNVATNGEKAEAIARAKSAAGVRSVKDEIRVVGGSRQSGGDRLDDASITARIKTAFAMDRGIVSKDIRVNTCDGVVMLTGNVKSEKQFDTAEKRARRVKGVKQVDNRICVE